VLAADPVHDLQRAAAGQAAGRAGHEGDELLGLVRAGADVERLGGQARVADPGVAVVPVALAADALGQRARGRGHDGARGPEGQALEHTRAELDELLVGALVDVVLSLPRAPALDRVVDAGGDELGGAGHRALADGRRPVQAEADALALAHREARAHGRVLDRRRDARRDGDLVGAAERAPAAVLHPEERPHEPVLGPRRELHLKLDRPRDALDEAQDLVRRVAPEVVAALAGREGHGVDQAHAAGRGGEDRLDDERAGQVAALGGRRADGCDRPVAGVGVEDAGEDGRRVVMGHAQPVDRPVAVDQGGRRAVGEQAVVGDRLEAGAAALDGGGGGLG